MSNSKEKRTSIKVPMATASDLREVGRFLDHTSDEKIEKPRTAALEMLTERFIEEHRSKFTKKIAVEEDRPNHYVFKESDQEA